MKKTLIDLINNLLINETVNIILKKEKTHFTQAYQNGLITKMELIQNSKLKDIHLTF